MRILMKTILPLALLVLILSGCNDQQKKPGSNQYLLPPPPTAEEREQQKKAVSEAHTKFSRLLASSTPRESNIRLNGVDPEVAQNLKKAEDFLAKLDELDASECPKDYQNAYNDLKDEWEKFFKLVVKNKGDLKIAPGPRTISADSFGGLGDFSNTYDIYTSDPEYKEALERIKTATKPFETAAGSFGFYHF